MISVSGTALEVGRSVVKGGFRFLAQVTGDDVAPDGPSGWVARAEWAHRSQAEGIYTTLAQRMDDAGALDGMCRQHIYQQDKRYYPTFERARLIFEPDTPTPSSGIGVGLLGARSDRTYEVDGIGLSADGLQRYGRPSVYETSSIGASASHYTQGLVVGPYLFTAGMIAVDPATATSVTGFDDVPEAGRFLRTGRTHPDSRTGPVAAQTWSLYQRIFTMLAERGFGPEQIASSTVYLSDPGDVADFARVHREVFGGWDLSPALQLVFVDEVGHHGTVVEIEVTAMLDPDVPLVRTTGADPEAPPTVVRAGELAFTSDVLALDDLGAPVTSLRRLSPATQQRLGAHRGALADELLAQLGGVVEALLATLDAAEVSREHLGFAYVRIVDPDLVAAADAVVAHLLDDLDVAVTVLAAGAIGHRPGALAVASGVCAGVPEA